MFVRWMVSQIGFISIYQTCWRNHLHIKTFTHPPSLSSTVFFVYLRVFIPWILSNFHAQHTNNVPSPFLSLSEGLHPFGAPPIFPSSLFPNRFSAFNFCFIWVMIFFVPNKHIDVCPRSLADLVKKQLKISREIVTDLFHYHTAPSPQKSTIR